MARSRGVTIYATYALILGSLNLAGNLVLAVVLAKMSGQAASQSMASPFKPLLGAVVSGLLISAGIGCFLLRRWGRTLAIAAACGTLALAFVNVWHIPTGDLPSRVGFVVGYAIFPVLLNGGILWFFARPGVVAQFR